MGGSGRLGEGVGDWEGDGNQRYDSIVIDVLLLLQVSVLFEQLKCLVMSENPLTSFGDTHEVTI